MDGCKFDGMRLAMDKKNERLGSQRFGIREKTDRSIIFGRGKFNTRILILDIPDKLFSLKSLFDILF